MDSTTLNIPNGWVNCPNISQLIADKIFVFKTLLGERYDRQIKPNSRFNWKILCQTVCSSTNKKLGLIIDLTNTHRYYNKRIIKNNNCLYVKLECSGFNEPPSVKVTNSFIDQVNSFVKDNPDKLVGVHCTHGFNRSGFVVVAYLCSVMNFDLKKALEVFTQARAPGIYKKDYLDELVKRYGAGCNHEFTVPPLPEWHTEAHMQNSMSLAKSNIASSAFGNVSNVKILSDINLVRDIQSQVCKMCQKSGNRFPGAQPVGITMENIKKLFSKKYLVSWKADGLRFMMLIKGKNQVYMFDRDFTVYQVTDLTFPSKSSPNQHTVDTLIDGEMVTDVFQGQKTPIFLIYDIITLENQSVKELNFGERQKLISTDIIAPRSEAINRLLIDKQKEPFGIKRKKFSDLTSARCYLDVNLNSHIAHDIDGLVFQPYDEPYRMGQWDDLLKWKPPHLNTIDFRLIIEKQQGEGTLPTNIGKLMVGGLAVPFSEIKLTRDLMKFDKKIIECSWDTKTSSWKFLRERIDKSYPNRHETAKSIMSSISNPITKELLFYIIDSKGYKPKSQQETKVTLPPSLNDQPPCQNNHNKQGLKRPREVPLYLSVRPVHDPLGLLNQEFECLESPVKVSKRF